jgi:hypothetical protein
MGSDGLDPPACTRPRRTLTLPACGRLSLSPGREREGGQNITRAVILISRPASGA